MYNMSVLNFVPHESSCPTCMTFLRVLHAYTLYVFAYLTCLSAFVPLFLTWLTCLHFFYVPYVPSLCTCITCIPFSHAFIFIVPYVPSSFYVSHVPSLIYASYVHSYFACFLCLHSYVPTFQLHTFASSRLQDYLTHF